MFVDDKSLLVDPGMTVLQVSNTGILNDSQLLAYFTGKKGASTGSNCFGKLKYRKILKISPSMYKPLQIYAPQTRNAKNPLLNRPSKYKPPGGLYLESCPQIQSKTKQKR